MYAHVLVGIISVLLGLSLNEFAEMERDTSLSSRLVGLDIACKTDEVMRIFREFVSSFSGSEHSKYMSGNHMQNANVLSMGCRCREIMGLPRHFSSA